MKSALRFAAASVVLAGCAQPIEGGAAEDHVGRTIQPIVGGIASGADQDAVVVLARFESGTRVGLCTATMIAANLAVTARHCVSQTDPSAACGADGKPVVGAMLHGDRAPGSLAVFAVTGGVSPDTTVDTGASARGKTLVVDASTTICNHDVAYVILDKALSGPIAPVRLAAPAAGDMLTAVGFGITEQGWLPSSRMQRGALALVGAGPMPLPHDTRYGVGDGEFVVGESSCLGDSGSPALASSGAVVGIASRAGNGQPRDPSNAASTCLGANAHAVYAQLGADPALALRAFAEAGATPWHEGQPDPRLPRADAPAGAIPGAGQAAPGAGTGNAAGSTAVGSSGALAPAGARDGEETAASGGCSASGEPTRGAVEHALGIFAMVMLIVRWRSARRRRDALALEAGAASLASSRGFARPESDHASQRIPYVDLGMRESLASFSDDH